MITNNSKLENLKGSRRFKIAVIIVIFAVIYFIVATFVKAPNENISYLIIGNVQGALMVVLGFYFGSADNDKEKDENTQNELME